MGTHFCMRRNFLTTKSLDLLEKLKNANLTSFFFHKKELFFFFFGTFKKRFDSYKILVAGDDVFRAL